MYLPFVDLNNTISRYDITCSDLISQSLINILETSKKCKFIERKAKYKF